MARKGWDALSDTYRDRLVRGGIDRGSYESGASLHGARGHKSAATESWFRDTNKFARETAWHAGDQANLSVEKVKREIRSMGRREGSKHIAHQRKLIRLYERGETQAARALWEQRDTSLPDYLFYYHGVFAYR